MRDQREEKSRCRGGRELGRDDRVAIAGSQDAHRPVQAQGLRGLTGNPNGLPGKLHDGRSRPRGRPTTRTDRWHALLGLIFSVQLERVRGRDSWQPTNDLGDEQTARSLTADKAGYALSTITNALADAKRKASFGEAPPASPGERTRRGNWPKTAGRRSVRSRRSGPNRSGCSGKSSATQRLKPHSPSS